MTDERNAAWKVEYNDVQMNAERNFNKVSKSLPPRSAHDAKPNFLLKTVSPPPLLGLNDNRYFTTPNMFVSKGLSLAVTYTDR